MLIFTRAPKEAFSEELARIHKGQPFQEDAYNLAQQAQGDEWILCLRAPRFARADSRGGWFSPVPQQVEVVGPAQRPSALLSLGPSQWPDAWPSPVPEALARQSKLASHTCKVGGQVRDQLLAQQNGVSAPPQRDRDWLSLLSASEMEALGFEEVGQSFAVFLHPLSREEYALPRVGQAHTNSLQEDLRHRDLTINAIAEWPDGTLYDPLGGARDLEQGILRVPDESAQRDGQRSCTFADDPVRILRLARFQSQLPGSWHISDDTRALAREHAHLLDGIPGERLIADIWKAFGDSPWDETASSAETGPVQFWRTLDDLGALGWVAPEVEALKQIPENPAHHPEKWSFAHSLLALEQACHLTQDRSQRMAALLHDLGKAKTDPAHWPLHAEHEEKGVEPLQKLAERWRMPKAPHQTAERFMRVHMKLQKYDQLRPGTKARLIEQLGLHKDPSQAPIYQRLSLADRKGRLQEENGKLPAIEPHALEHLPAYELERDAWLVHAVRAQDAVGPDRDLQLVSGKKIGAMLQQMRAEVILYAQTPEQAPPALQAVYERLDWDPRLTDCAPAP